MIKHGIRDVNKFLLWLQEYHPDKTIGSLVYNRDKPRLEKEMNMQVRRYWFTKPFMEHLEGRREQCEQLEAKGMILSVEESIKAAKDIITKNGYDFQVFVNDVFHVLYKKKNKINTLYFQGVSNSCKSTIAWSIINCTPNYSQGMASTDFMYHNCANSSIIFFGEMKITPDVINEMKCVVERSETCTNRTFGDGFYLPRTPVVALIIMIHGSFVLLKRILY